jgi:PKD repeat protein
MKYTIILFQTILTISNICLAQSGKVLMSKRFTNATSIFGQNIINVGSSVISLGDLNKDGYVDLFSTAIQFGGTYPGSMNLFFFNKQNIFKSINYKPGVNGFPDAYNAVSCLGDLGKDGGVDVAISNAVIGVVYIVSINSDGIILKVSEIQASDVNPNGNSSFGYSLSSVGDIDKDGVYDLAIGANADNDGGSQKGAIYIVFLTANGQMKGYQKISSLQGNFTGIFNGYLGNSITAVGDLNKDSINDIIAGSGTANSSDDHWVLFLNRNGTVKKHQKLTQYSGNFDFVFNPFIGNVRPRNAGDINGDGTNDLFMSFLRDTINGRACGSSRLLFMDTTGKVKNSTPIDYSSFISDLGDGDKAQVVDAGFDLNGDYKYDLILGVPNNDFGGTDKGVFYIVSMDGAIHPVQPKSRFTAKDTTGITTKTFTFTNTSSGYPKQARWSFTPNTVTYQNSTTETSLDSVQVKFTAAGTYAVKLWVQNPFGEDSLLKTNHITVSPIGGFEEFRSNPFTLYPIPATTELMVNGGEDLSGAVTLSIQNCLGEILSTETRLFTSNIPQVLNTSDIPQGLYLLSISYNNVSYTLKFVK